MTHPTVSPAGPASLEPCDTDVIGWAWADRPVSELEAHYAVTGTPRPMDGDSLVATYPARLRPRRWWREQVRDTLLCTAAVAGFYFTVFAPSMLFGGL